MGGLLFECYLEGLSSFTTHKKWRSIQASVAVDNAYQADLQEQNDIVQKEKGDFHGFVLKSTANIGNTGKNQLFFLTFVAKYHGLSNMGAEILGKYGFGTMRTQYHSLKEKTIDAARARTR